MAVALGIGLVGAAFYAVVTNNYLGAVLGGTLGPYSDMLAEQGFSDPDPGIWAHIAAVHGLAIVVEFPGAEPLAFDSEGQPTSLPDLERGQVRAIRTGAGGERVTFIWTLSSVAGSHLALLGGLLFMVLAVVGSAFWFLQHQLRPLAGLQIGVEAVARGDFETRVAIVRNDEIGRVAGAFNDMADRVGEMIADRERLLADVSHELRSPIARMKVALEFMPEGAKREALAADLREMEGLIGVLLERERLRSRDSRSASEEIDLASVAAEVVSTFAGQSPGLELVADPVVPIRADRALLKLLIRNLVDNALKFSLADSRPVVVTLESNGREVVLRVADDGSGIPEGSEERLFEPFVKADRARGHGVGYGLGLNLCQRIVQLHDGTIRLLARQPRGTEAVVTLSRE